MKILRFVAEGLAYESLGILVDDLVVDLSRVYYQKLLEKGVSEEQALSETKNFIGSFKNFAKVWYELKKLIDDVFTKDKSFIEENSYKLSDVKILPPIAEPSKIIGVALNYRDHAEETGRPIPKQPLLFFKTPNSIIGHKDNIIIPKHLKKVDYEAELVVIIGKKGKNIPVENAYSYVLGYTIGNDVSSRDIQFGFPGHTFHSWGKSFDTFAPIGPWVVTPDEIGNPHDLSIKLYLNGEKMQDSTTGNMVFKINELISYISRGITLEPGDLIFTGTPAGVGAARKPPRFLKDGDHIKIAIDKIGVLENFVVEEKV